MLELQDRKAKGNSYAESVRILEVSMKYMILRVKPSIMDLCSIQYR